LLTEPITVSDPRMMTGAQIRAARSILRLTAGDLAALSGVGIATIHRAEASDGIPAMNARTLARIQAAIEAAGVTLIDNNAVSASGGPGVRLSPKAS
jgi:DNA-binding transcriptional regulator YiaG